MNNILDIKMFGNFIGLFNKAANTNYTVKSCLKNESLIQVFNTIKNDLNAIASINTLTQNLKSKSTKGRSYSQLNIPKLDAKVLELIQKYPSHSRQELSTISGTRLQSICSASNRLLANKLIYVDGETVDAATNRHVETLKAGIR